MHVLERQIDAVGSRVRRLLIVHGLCWGIGVAVASVLLLAIADYLLRWEDRGLRIMALLAVVGVTAWAVRRFLAPALRYRPTAVEIAQHVEHRYPGLSERLASTIEFLREPEDDPRAGSAMLRRAVILQTESDAADLDWNNVVDLRATRRAGAIAGGILVIGVAVALFAPRYAAIGLARLFNPLGNAVWPHVHELAFTKVVTRLALGQPFELEVIDRHGTPPDDVRMQYRYPGSGHAGEDEEKVQLVNGSLLARKDQVTRPFEYRAVGGDDRSMAWISLEVVEPPRIENLEITLHPPEYSGFEPQPVASGARRIEALVGTRVELTGSVSKQLASAVLKRENDVAVPATISTDAESFSISASGAQPLIVDKSGHFWLELTDREQLVGGAADRWEVRALADSPPSVSLEQPAANLYVTAEATVPIRAVVHDNLAIRQIRLAFTRTDQSPASEQTVELYTGPEAATPATGESMTSAAGESRTIEFTWDLSPLTMAPGTQILCHVAADDYQPKSGVSTNRKLTIVTPAELEERLTAREMTILAEVARILKSQREVRGQTAGLVEQFSHVGSLRKQDIDQLQGAEMNQRQLRRSLASPSEGVAGQIAGLLAELESNRLDSPEISRRLQQMSGEIARLDREPLAEIQQQLTAAVKSAELEAAGAESSVKLRLESTGRRQDEVIGSLEKLLDDLAQWNNFRGLARDIGQIRREQSDLEKRTRTVGQETLTRDAKDLTTQQAADLKTMARGQDEIARQFEKVVGHMQRLSGQSEDGAPAGSPSAADALQAARDLGLTSQMRESSRDVENNRIGQSLEKQSAIEHGLDELIDILANRREQELSRLVKKLREAEEKLVDVRHQQEGLQKKMQSLADEAKHAGANKEEIKRQLERLSRQQKSLQEEARRLVRQLQRLQSDKAADTIAHAAGEMERAEGAAEQGDSEKARDEAAQAQRDLDDAQQQLAERRRQAERDLAQEELAKITDALKSLTERQGHIVEESFTYDGHRQSPQGLTRAQSQSVLDLGRNQTGLAAETTATAEKIAAAEVFHLALQQAADDMSQAADLLSKLETGSATQKAASRALERLQQIQAALSQDKGETPPKPSDGGGGAGAGGNSPQGAEIANLAELRLLRLMQEQINSRTREVDQAARKQATLTDDQRHEYTEIARQQGQLAELLLKKTAPAGPNPEDNPEKLPDLRRTDGAPK